MTDGMSGVLGAHEIYFHKLARPLAEIRLTVREKHFWTALVRSQSPGMRAMIRIG